MQPHAAWCAHAESGNKYKVAVRWKASEAETAPVGVGGSGAACSQVTVNDWQLTLNSSNSSLGCARRCALQELRQIHTESTSQCVKSFTSNIYFCSRFREPVLTSLSLRPCNISVQFLKSSCHKWNITCHQLQLWRTKSIMKFCTWPVDWMLEAGGCFLCVVFKICSAKVFCFFLLSGSLWVCDDINVNWNLNESNWCF